MSHADSIVHFRDLLSAANRIVVFTGAGISTESGIPDFRSPGGIWTKIKPIDFSDFISSEEMQRESWRRKIASDSTMRRAQPNRGHRAVKALWDRGLLSSVITQNVDGLHQDSGVPEDRVIELHGNSSYAKCLECQRRYELEPIYEAFEQRDELPFCPCGGIVKTATISFGQPMPVIETERAQEETLACDFFLVLGTSLVVYPAAALPIVAKESGATVVIMNRESTDLDPIADLVLHEEIGPTLGDVIGVD